FYDDFVSRLWFTYRARYPAIAGSAFTTDSGWGCMLRAGQMILAQALMVRFLGREWKRPSDGQPVDHTYQQIVSWFLDELSATTPFSIHHMTALGKQFGKNVGEWFGPHGTANIIKELTKDHAECGLAVHIVPDGVVYRDLVLEDATAAAGGDGEFRPMLILVTTRLGIDFLNPYYYPFITSCLMNPSCVGIGGGKPSSALYISFGQPRSDTILLYLDPHYTRPAIPAGTSHLDLTREQLDTYHCTSVRRVPISKLDPSMMIGFLVRTKGEFE
ncbi:peptidase C54, partial [Ramicandelaber brevisporus]